MILKYEIEQFIQEIENKLPTLQGNAYDSAKDKINILNRVSIEFMEYEDLLKKVALMNSKAQVDALKLTKEVMELRAEVEHLKENIK
jgi:hypothetical protein